MKIIALLNQKGGVGKTTSTVNVGAALSKFGLRILLIDLDPQSNLTYSLGIKAHELDNSVYNLLKGDASISDVVIQRDGFHVLPSSLNLAGAEIEFSGIPGREFLLNEAIDRHNNYDYILIDCPPSLGLLTLNALTSSHEIFIPLQTEFLPMQGMAKILQTVDVIKKRLNSKLEITGVICNRFDRRKNLNREVVETIKNHFGDKVFKTFIRDNISLAEAPGFGKTIFEYKPNSCGAQDFLNLSKEIIERYNHEGNNE